MNTYDYQIKMTYRKQDGGHTRTIVGSVSCEGIGEALRLATDDEGYSWPEKRASREVIWIIKQGA